MVTFLLSISVVSLGIWGIHILFQEGHLLEKVGDKAKDYWWAKPVFNCPICMSSVWGVIGFFSIGYLFDPLALRQLLPFILCLCGFNTIIAKLTTKERIIVDE